MRALPLIERVLMFGVLVLIVLFLLFLLTWHLRWRAMIDGAAALSPWPGAQITVSVPVPDDVIQDFKTWVAEAAAPCGAGADADFRSVANSDPGEGMIFVPPAPGDAFAGLGPSPAGKDGAPPEGVPALAPELAKRLDDLLAHGLRLGLVPTAPDIELWTGETFWDHTQRTELWDDYGSRTMVLDLCLRAALCWRRAGDLDALDRLIAALGPMAWEAGNPDRLIRVVRDAAYLDAQLAHALPEARRARWRAESDGIERLLAVVDLRRRRWMPAMGAARFARISWAWYNGNGRAPRNRHDLLQNLSEWWSTPRICARQVAMLGVDLATIAANDRSHPLADYFVGRDVRMGMAACASNRFARLASDAFAAWAQGATPVAAMDQAGRGGLRAGCSTLSVLAYGPCCWVVSIVHPQNDDLDPQHQEHGNADPTAVIPDDGSVGAAWDGDRLLLWLPASATGCAAAQPSATAPSSAP